MLTTKANQKVVKLYPFATSFKSATASNHSQLVGGYTFRHQVSIAQSPVPS